MTNMQEWLSQAEAQLRRTGIQSARLDAALLLANYLQKSQTWLLAHNNETLNQQQLSMLDKQLARRLNHEPLAYIRGFHEFYGKDFTVNQHVLIPRPETETIIEIIAALTCQKNDILVDIGTGSGCIAISAKLVQPLLNTYGVDVSKKALLVAQHNAARLGAEVTFLHSDLLKNPAVPRSISVITANLPYVDHSWQVSPETSFEPPRALYARNKGLELIYKLLAQAPLFLRPQGHLILEADTRQHKAIIQKAQSAGFRLLLAERFILHFQI